MNGEKNSQAMTEHDELVVTYLNKLIELDKAGKFEYLSCDEVFGKLKAKIVKAEKQRSAKNSVFQRRSSSYAGAL